jgi:tRNA nucleotidyltransferase/poly(A) polymerase
LLNVIFHYANYVNVKLKIDSFSVDITTLREEAGYKDLRHPQSISFIKEISRDYLRRDFTINALYIDEKLQVYDFCGGQEDLKNRIIRMIGEPNLRLQEDPLRILRALRFKLKLGFEFEPSLERAIVNNIDMLDYIKPAKINEELAKIRVIDEPAATRLLMSYGIREHY